MVDRIKASLLDILQQVDEVDAYFNDVEKTFSEYQKDRMLQRAIERNISIIGEAVSRIRQVDPDFEIENSKRIIATRNRVVHAYDSVSDDVMWSIVVNHLPKLEKEIQSLLEE